MENSASAALSINLNTPTQTHTQPDTHTNGTVTVVGVFVGGYDDCFMIFSSLMACCDFVQSVAR